MDENYVENREPKSRPLRRKKSIAEREVNFLFEDEEINLAVLNEDDKQRNLFTPKRTLKKASELYACNFCSAVFSSISQLCRHSEVHSLSPNKVHTCEECNIVFGERTKLMNHGKLIHMKNFECAECDANFVHLKSFKLHERQHTGEKPYSCNECGAKFLQKSHLNVHKRIHTGEKPYQCAVCQQNFKQSSHLQTHRRVHMRDKPYTCDICNVAFTQSSSLKRHKKVHTGERPYVCEVCSASFSIKTNLSRHMTIHSSIARFQCNICSSTFNQKHDLERHTNSHFKFKPFKCEQCGASFTRKSYLKYHVYSHTGETPFKCDQCQIQFSKPWDLKKHKLAHSSADEVISKRNEKNKRSGENSNRSEFLSNKKNPISYIHKEYISIKKITKSHQCSLCKKIFRRIGLLRKHKEKCKFETSHEIVKYIDTANQFQNSADSLPLSVVQQPVTIDEQNQIVQEQKYDTITSVVSEKEKQNQFQKMLPTSPGIPTLIQSSMPPTLLFPSYTGQAELRTGKINPNCPNQISHLFALNMENQWQNYCFCNSVSKSVECLN